MLQYRGRFEAEGDNLARKILCSFYLCRTQPHQKVVDTCSITKWHVKLNLWYVLKKMFCNFLGTTLFHFRRFFTGYSYLGLKLECAQSFDLHNGSPTKVRQAFRYGESLHPKIWPPRISNFAKNDRQLCVRVCEKFQPICMGHYF